MKNETEFILYTAFIVILTAWFFFWMGASYEIRRSMDERKEEYRKEQISELREELFEKFNNQLRSIK